MLIFSRNRFFFLGFSYLAHFLKGLKGTFGLRKKDTRLIPNFPYGCRSYERIPKIGSIQYQSKNISPKNFMMVRERSKSKWWGFSCFPLSNSFHWPSRTIAKHFFPTLQVIGKIVPLSLLFLFTITAPATADTTLEILNLVFPDSCGASKCGDLKTCTLCHFSIMPNREGDQNLDSKNSLPLPQRKITSMEEMNRITVFVPAVPLKPDQLFTQKIMFNGPQIFFEYSYCKDNGPVCKLDSQWILCSPKQDFLEKHDGKMLPLLREPGEYIFILKLLHDRHKDRYGDLQWEQVVLLWTLSVVAKN